MIRANLSLITDAVSHATAVLSGGVLSLYGGDMPTDPDASITATAIVTVAWPGLSVNASTGTASLLTPLNTTAVSSGTITWGAIVSAGGILFAGASTRVFDLVLANHEVLIGDAVSVLSFELFMDRYS